MLPVAFVQRMRDLLGEEAEEFLASLEKESFQALRLNAWKAEPEAFLQKCPFHLSRVPWAEDGFYYGKEDQPGKHPYHEAGAYYIQEPSAMLPVTLLSPCPGERVMDLCAAPGGKSTQIAAAMKGAGILVSNEIHPARAKILSENVERLGGSNCLVTNETPQRLAEAFPDYFDRVLVDAPCSGEGMFRKKEEAREEWSLDNVRLCAARQDEILDQAARMVRPGGRLVYSTCTFEPAENEGSVARFLMRHGEFSLEDAAGQMGGMAPVVGRGEGPVAAAAAGQAESSAPAAGGFAAGQPARGTFLPGRAEWCVDVAGAPLDCDAALAQSLSRTVRLWPHRLDGEGHFAAVLRRAGDWDGQERAWPANGLEKGISRKECADYFAFEKEALTAPIEELLGRLDPPAWDGQECGRIFLRFGDQLYISPQGMPSLKGLKVLRPGLHLGTLKKGRFEPSHALALFLKPQMARHCDNLEADGPKVQEYLKGNTFPAQGDKGWHLVAVDGYSLGWGKLAGGILKNHYPKGLRR